MNNFDHFKQKIKEKVMKNDQKCSLQLFIVFKYWQK